MASRSLVLWQSHAIDRLRELENVHTQLGGTRPGRRWGTTQLNRSLFLVLVAQFQGFCRNLHDESVGVYLGVANVRQQDNLYALLVQGRRLSSRNPRRSVLGHDFARLGLPLVEDLRARGARTLRDLDSLDRLVDYRNALAHGDETRVDSLEATGTIKATKRSYVNHRRILDRLAGTMDQVVAEGLARSLGISEPW